MINLELILAISSYYFVMFATPGPNNSILTASGIKFGFIRTIPNIFGIPFGHALQLTLVILGLGKISETNEKVSPLKFYEAVLFQFINPKAWVICVTAVALFFPYEENYILGIVFMVLMAVAICFPSISMWALGGSIIRHYLKNKKIKIVVEWLLAILLFGTAITIMI